jgi:hypothetical protein
MIETTIQTIVSPECVWQAWRRVHALEEGLTPNQKGVLKTEGGSRFSYRLLDVKEGESFSILWKSLFVRMIFTHRVTPKGGGSEICYCVQIRGFFAWPVRYLLSNKIRSNLQLVLRSLVKQLETG